jgi:hypothetical protein
LFVLLQQDRVRSLHEQFAQILVSLPPSTRLFPQMGQRHFCWRRSSRRTFAVLNSGARRSNAPLMTLRSEMPVSAAKSSILGSRVMALSSARSLVRQLSEQVLAVLFCGGSPSSSQYW